MVNLKFIPAYGEWFYGIEKPRILIEEFLEDGTGEPPKDYKVFCFNGKPKFIRVDVDRFKEQKTNMYDLDWNKLNVTYGHLNFEDNSVILNKQLTKDLIEVSCKLSKGFPHVRVDLYVINNRIYFGELTFTSTSGFDRIKPYDFDLLMGREFSLSKE